MLNSIKRRAPLKLKQQVRSIIDRENVDLPEGRKAFVFLAADYGNIGDIAITAAQRRFLASYAGHPHVVEVPISKTRIFLHSIRKQSTPSDLVTVIGGGNMGSLYSDIEALRQLVIRSFPRNRIVCFPQTLDWEDSPESAKAIERIVDIYSGHGDLHVFAREAVSRDKLRDLFSAHDSVRVGYAPDVVLSATATDLGADADTSRDGILLCMRGDRERAVTEEQRQALGAALARTGLEVEVTDTHAGGSGLSEDQCRSLLRDKVDQFRSARLVVTDRLHGMIMSVVAGTPCLVLPNSNHKIRQTYTDWLSDHPLIQFVSPDQLASVDERLGRMLASVPARTNVPPVDVSHYAELQKALTRP